MCNQVTLLTEPCASITRTYISLMTYFLKTKGPENKVVSASEIAPGSREVSRSSLLCLGKLVITTSAMLFSPPHPWLPVFVAVTIISTDLYLYSFRPVQKSLLKKSLGYVWKWRTEEYKNIRCIQQLKIFPIAIFLLHKSKCFSSWALM